ncbi:hydrolase [Solihabitans fulvus]|uniref:Hydrolase n=1 Tax=Solihabitans fulvus TaxID=1892852 RepID=A0A5B2XWH7_9PSEU|nr:putative Ig domain-containing protein [Solihabitans fulvus]KAA2267044.1 hydrolase [Solihabitans fulvus]
MRLRQLALAGVTLASGLLAAATVTPAIASVPPAHRAAATQHRVLFDDTKAETAGNADWIISTSMPDPLAQNPAPASETDWTGAISSWGVALQRTGQYSLKTLPPGNSISYGNTGNPLDLTNFDTFVLPEPNIVLSSAEKAALMHFVQNGGGLFLISDHTGSDRNNDGWDSPAIINDLMTNNGVANNDPFGFSVDLKNIVKDFPVAINDPANPVLNGSFGSVQHSLIANGTTFTLNPADNPNVRGLLYLSTATPGNTNAFFVTSTFGSGRVAVWGDSSPPDDGTGEPGKKVYNGWNDPGANNAALALNATAWLAGTGGGTTGGVTVTNPGNQTGTVGTPASLQLQASDTAGGTLSYQATGLPAGLSVNAGTGLISGTPTTAGTGTVNVTATDSTGPSGSTSFGWTINPTGGGGGCTPANLLGNPGFESGAASPWTASSASIVNSGSAQPAHGGSWDAWLGGKGSTHTDTLAQTVTLPTGCATYGLSFWLHVDTAETTTTRAYDTLKAQVLDGSGAVLSTLATYSNLNAGSGYTQRTFNLAAYAGKTVTVKFTGAEDYTKQTSFVIDDAALSVS